jgi:hypothetical protein
VLVWAHAVSCYNVRRHVEVLVVSRFAETPSCAAGVAFGRWKLLKTFKLYLGSLHCRRPNGYSVKFQMSERNIFVIRRRCRLSKSIS